MNLDQLKQEAENLQTVDVTKLSAEQLESLVEKLSKMLDINESFLEETKSQLEEIKIEDNEPDNK
jgi:hypothetical protein